uniref:Uncharacterized protein n=1 Tax=Rhodosorus marinus TaxID=101924 RepID=A0A7S2ZSV5_9RHOD|mmetsp:Transcript_29836/g.114562  ORF Transcript_29836/g.114562 Transcript_29836/m.114562 type:complete len:230 (+) Transcript_29836:139-828(+)
MEGLDTEGIEFYDDTSGVPSHGFTSEVTPKAGDERRGGREILPGDDGGKREYERRMSPFGMDDSRGFQTLFDEIEKSFSGFSRRGNDPSGEMNSMFGRLFDGFFGGADDRDIFSGSRIPFGEFAEGGSQGGSTQTYSFSSKSYYGPDGQMYEERRSRNGDGPEEVEIRRRDPSTGTEVVTRQLPDGLESNQQRTFSSMLGGGRARPSLPSIEDEPENPKTESLWRRFWR